MKKKILCLLFCLSVFFIAGGVITVSAADDGEMILLSSYGSGSCINTDPMELSEGDGAAVYMDFAYLEGEAESIGFVLAEDPYEEGVSVLLSGEGAQASGGNILRGRSLTAAGLLSEEYEIRGEFYPSEGTFRILRRGRRQIDWQTVLLCEEMPLPEGEVYCGLILNGQCDLWLNAFRIEKVLCGQDIGSTFENIERSDRYTIGAGSDFSVQTERENRIANGNAFYAEGGEVRLNAQVRSFSGEYAGFGISASEKLFTEEGVFIRYGAAGTEILVGGVAYTSAQADVSLSLSDVFATGCRPEAVFQPSAGIFELYDSGKLRQRITGFPAGAYLYAGMQLAAGTQAEFGGWGISVSSQGGGALSLGGDISLEMPDETAPVRTESDALYSFGGQTFYPDGEGGFYTEEEYITEGEDLPLVYRGMSLESGMLVSEDVGYAVNAEPADLSREGASLVMEYSVGETVDTSSVAAGNWLGIVLTDFIPEGESNNLYSTNPQNALMAFPKAQQWQAGISMDDAFSPDTDYRITYDPAGQTLTYEYRTAASDWRLLGNGIYLPSFGAGVNVDNSRIYLGFQTYYAPAVLSLSGLRIYPVQRETVTTSYPSLGDITQKDGYIANRQPFDLNDAAAYIEFTVQSFSLAEGADASAWGISWNHSLVNATYLCKTLFGEYPLLSFSGENGMPSAEELFLPGMRICISFDPGSRTVSVSRRAAGVSAAPFEEVARVRVSGAVCFDGVYFGIQLAEGVRLEMQDISLYSLSEGHTVRKVYRSEDEQGNTVYIAESTGSLSHESALDPGEGEVLNAALTVLEYTAPADRVLIGEDENSVLAPYFEVHVSSSDPHSENPGGFGIRYYNTTTREFASQTALVGEPAAVAGAKISADLTQFDVFPEGKLRFCYDPAAGVFSVLHGEDPAQVMQTIYGIRFRAEQYYISFVMQDGIKLKTNDLCFYTSEGFGAMTAYDSMVAADEWTGDGRTGSSISKTTDAGLTLSGDQISLVSEWRTYNAGTSLVNGYAGPMILSESADISGFGDYIAMEFTVLSFEDLQRTINYFAFGLVSGSGSTPQEMAMDTEHNLFICYRPSYGVADSYYFSHFWQVVPGIFSQRHVSQSNFMKSGATVRVSFHNGGERNSYPYYELSYKTAAMEDFEVLQYVYALTSMPLSGVRLVFAAAGNEENPAVNTTMRYVMRDLRFYTSGSAEQYEYDGTEDVFVSHEPSIIPVRMTAETNDSSLGNVEGGGTFLRGDSVSVRAFATEGAIFEGWYLKTPESDLTGLFVPANRLSKESDFTFTLGDTVENNRAFTLVARFVPAVQGKIVTRSEEIHDFGIGLIYTVSANIPVGQALDHWELNGTRLEKWNEDGSVTFTVTGEPFTLQAFYKAAEGGNSVTITEKNEDKRAADAVTAATAVLASVTVCGIGGMIAYAVVKKRR